VRWPLSRNQRHIACAGQRIDVHTHTGPHRRSLAQVCVFSCRAWVRLQ
jgi:hypothetical protein